MGRSASGMITPLLLVLAGTLAFGEATVPNNGFEDLDSSGFPVFWTRIGASSGTQSSFKLAYDSYLSLGIEDNSSDTSHGVRSDKISGVSQGADHTVSAKCYVESGAAYVYVEYYNSGNVLLLDKKAKNTLLNKWHRVSVTAAAPSGTDYLRVKICSARGDISRAYVDNVLVGDEIVEIGSRKQLFVDNYIIEDLGTAVRSLHRGEKHPKNPVLSGDAEWEDRRIIYPNVIKEGNQYKMWYVTPEDMWNIATYHTGYAYSDDGMNWTKPILNLVDFEGSTTNNLIWKYRVGSLVKNPNGAGYYMYRSEYNAPVLAQEYRSFYSPDDGRSWSDLGLHMDRKKVEKNPDTAGMNYSVMDIELLAYDETNKKYILSTKMNDMEVDDRYGDKQTYKRHFWVDAKDDMKDLYGGPFPTHMYGLADAEDLFPETHTWPYTDTNRYQQVNRIDPYFIQVFPYEGVYIGFISMFYIEALTWKSGWGHYGGIDVHLAVSRDLTKQFQKPFRKQPVLPRGERRSDAKGPSEYHAPDNNDWDWGMVSLVCPPVVTEDKIMAWYNGANCRHNLAPKPGKQWQIGLVTWRLDGFVSLDSDASEDVVTTKKLIFNGNQLTLNADASAAQAQIQVEIVDDAGKVIKGRSDPVTGDSLKHVVYWAGNDDVGNIAGQTVVLKFCTKNSKFYALRFTPDAQGRRSGG